ncbi:MAG: TonB-dependent siderophore receptor [Burkholderiaceae bacterium]
MPVATACHYAGVALLLASMGAATARAQDVPSTKTEGSPANEAAGLPEVVVTAGRPGEQGPIRGYVAEESRVGTKTRTSILETPQSVSVVTRQQMDVQQTTSTSQALRYTAGATSEKYGGFGAALDITRIRGVDADYYLDGLRINGNTGTWGPQIDPFTLERIEVLRGPSSSLYGQSTGGGIINQVSRRPEDIASHELNIQIGNFGRKFVGFDSTGPLNEEKTLSYRLTATALDTNGQIEDVRHKRVYVAPSMTWRPNADTSWTLLVTHSNEPRVPNYSTLPAVALGLNDTAYSQVSRKRNYMDMGFDDSSRRQDSISSIFEQEFSNGWRLKSGIRYMHINSDVKRASVEGYRDVGGVMQLRGTYYLAPSSSDTFSMDNHIHGEFRLGKSRHELLVGIDYQTGTIRNALYSGGSYYFDPYGSNYRLDAIPDFTASRAAPWNVRQEFDRIGIYVQDQISHDRWRLTLGARRDQSRTNDWTHNYSPAVTHTRMEDGKWTGRAGLSYQFDAGIAPYLSYSTSFDPLLGSDFSGKALAPVQARQSEIGIKYHPGNSRTLLSAAIFQLSQTNVKTPDANHIGFYTQAGEVRTRGIDLQATTEIVPRLNLIASYTYLDNELVEDTRYQGRSLTQTPRHSAAIWLDYLIGDGPLSGLRGGGGVRYLGASYGDPTNDFKVPGAALVDLALNYDLGRLSSGLRGSMLALNITNLTNKQYVASCTSRTYCFIGQDRTIAATLSYRW